MNEFHRVNRSMWNDHAADYKLRVDKQNCWDKCHLDPLIYAGMTQTEREAFGNLKGKRACVLGSGNNCMAFALAGLGASVISVDISGNQLRYARARADFLGLDVSFITADVTDVGICSEAFDAIHTGGHVAMWVSDLKKYYAEAVRILKKGGVLVIKEHHPFQTIWSPSHRCLVVERPYGELGPYLEEGNEDDPYVFNWRVSDYVNAILQTDCELLVFDEIGNGEWAADEESEPDFRGLPDSILLVARKI